MKSRFLNFGLFLAFCLLAVLKTTAVRAEATIFRVPTKIDDMPALQAGDYVNSLAVAFDCLGSLALHARKVKGSLERAIADGQRLLALQTVDGSGRSGWPYRPEMNVQTQKCGEAGALPSFAGPCNPPETPYMIQTGYAVACLAQLHVATEGDREFLRAAERAVTDSWSLGTSPDGCHGCFYYWYGYNRNDHQRYVRNTNLIMGLGLTWLYAATGKQEYRERALAIAAAEHREIAAGNYGYYGIDDSSHKANGVLERKRIENHIPHHVKALKDIGVMFGNQNALEDSKRMLDAYLNCDSPHCRPANCRDWAVPLACKGTMTIAPCIMADRDETNSRLCIETMRVFSRLNAFQVFLSVSTNDPVQLKNR